MFAMRVMVNRIAFRRPPALNVGACGGIRRKRETPKRKETKERNQNFSELAQKSCAQVDPVLAGGRTRGWINDRMFDRN